MKERFWYLNVGFWRKKLSNFQLSQSIRQLPTISKNPSTPNSPKASVNFKF